MPRTRNGLEVLKGISRIEAFSIVSAGGDTTTTAALDKGDAIAPVTAITAFTAGDPIFIIGSGGVELNKIGTPNLNMPLAFKAAIAQDIGAQVVEAVARDLGHVDTNGINYSASLQLVPVEAATSAVAIAQMRGAGEQSASFNLLGMNNLNTQLAHGVDEGETGAGTEADPHQVSIGGTELGTHGIQCFRVTGYRFDLKTVTFDFLNATIEVAVRKQIGGRSPAVTPVQMKFDRLVQRIWG